MLVRDIWSERGGREGETERQKARERVRGVEERVREERFEGERFREV